MSMRITDAQTFVVKSPGDKQRHIDPQRTVP
jgi:hypothetical protein